MAAVRVGATQMLAAASGVGSYAQPPIAGNLLVAGVQGYIYNAAITVDTPAGWTSAGSDYVIQNFNKTQTFLFWKIATGGDAAPVFTSNVSLVGIIEEWSGLTASPFDTVSTWGKNAQNSAAAGSLSSGPVTTTTANELIWSFFGARVFDFYKTLTWDGGSSLGTNVDQVVTYMKECSSGNQITFSIGTYTPAISWVGTGGTFNSAVHASIAFKIIPPNAAPNAPTQNTPVNNATLDLALTNRFAFTPLDPDAGDTQTKFDLQYQIVGSGSWTLVSQPTANGYWDAPPNTFIVNNYEWQVRTYDAAGLVGPYSASRLFTAARVFIGWGIPI